MITTILLIVLYVIVALHILLDQQDKRIIIEALEKITDWNWNVHDYLKFNLQEEIESLNFRLNMYHKDTKEKIDNLKDKND